MTMRLMIMHKHDEHTQAGERADPELIARMGTFIGEYAQKGQFLAGEGLGASATSATARSWSTVRSSSAPSPSRGISA
jgi:hypothetical protein